MASRRIRMGRFALALIVAFGASGALGQDRERDTSRGDAMIAAYFDHQARALARADLAGVESLEDWAARRGELRRELLHMLGLEPMPARTPLEARVTGIVEHEDFTVEKVHFQSRPGLYVTGNLYVPKGLEGPAPAVLYVCGHAGVIDDSTGISYGNKVSYHHHGAWFARHGYVCLTIDSLQYGEIEGIHHGTYRYDRWWWNSRGYTPAGVEAWNCMRALDYLERREEVDAERMGVTGRSGGGAYSWWVGAVDERVAAGVPVAGITDLHNHIADGGSDRYHDGVVEGHCDCMYMLNTFRWDFPLVAALYAPRPLLISNSDKDKIFPLEGVVRLHQDVRRVYRLHDAEDRLGLQITEGPHRDTQVLRVHAFSWFDRFLRGEQRLIEDAAEDVFTREQLRVFHELPADETNSTIDEHFVATAETPSPPESAAQWADQREGWMRGLKDYVFRGWPDDPGPLEVTRHFDVTRRGVRFAAYELSSQREVRLPLYVVRRADDDGAAAVRLHVMDEAMWRDGVRVMRGPFADVLEGLWPPGENAGGFEALRQELFGSDLVFAYIAPRGIGPTAWDEDEAKRIQIRRRFMLLGQTLDGMRVWDVRRAVAALGRIDATRHLPVRLTSAGTGAGVALYASLFEPRVERLELADLSPTHRQGPILLNVLRYLDMPQAAAMAAERTPLVLHVGDRSRWRYLRETAEALGWGRDRLLLVQR